MFLRIPPRVGLHLAFFFSMLSAMLTGIYLSYNVYALPLKGKFNYTQTQVEIVVSVGTVGVSLGFLHQILTWLLGYNLTFLIVATGVPITSFLCTVTAYYGSTFHQWPAVVSFIQLLNSASNTNGYIVVTRVFVELYPRKYTGKLVSFYMAASGIGKIFFGLQMNFLFKDNLADFFLSLSVYTTLCYGACLLFLYPIATSKERQTELGLNLSTNVVDDDKGVDSKTQNSKDILHSPFLHLIFWCSVTFHAATAASVTNITALVESLGITYPQRSAYVISVVIILTRISFGILFDKFTSKWCWYTLLMVMYCSFIVAVLTVLFSSNMVFIYVAVIGFGLARASGLVIPVSIIVIKIGRSYYSAATACFWLINSTLILLLQVMTGFLYDSEIQRLGLDGTTCYGISCFRWTFVIMLSITVVVIVLQSINFFLSERVK